MNLTTRTLAAVLTALSMVPAWAAVIEADSASQTINYNAVISATDLINVGQASLASVSQEGNLLGGSLDGSHDGIGQNGSSVANTAFINDPITLTYTLNTTVGTGGSATGYTITAVDVVVGWWSGSAFSQQNWSVAVATVANPTVFATQLATVAYSPYSGGADTYGYTHVRLTDSTGALASGIGAVQFAFGGGLAVVSEIDVTGLTTPVPEPAALTLLLAGLLGVGMRHRRPAKR